MVVIGQRRTLLNNLRRLALLEDNWDSYWAKPVTPCAINVAKEVAMSLDLNLDCEVGPTISGGVVFEFSDATGRRCCAIECTKGGKMLYSEYELGDYESGCYDAFIRPDDPEVYERIRRWVST